MAGGGGAGRDDIISEPDARKDSSQPDTKQRECFKAKKKPKTSETAGLRKERPQKMRCSRCRPRPAEPSGLPRSGRRRAAVRGGRPDAHVGSRLASPRPATTPRPALPAAPGPDGRAAPPPRPALRSTPPPTPGPSQPRGESTYRARAGKGGESGGPGSGREGGEDGRGRGRGAEGAAGGRQRPPAAGARAGVRERARGRRRCRLR